jgi:hypothetical protein
MTVEEESHVATRREAIEIRAEPEAVWPRCILRSNRRNLQWEKDASIDGASPPTRSYLATFPSAPTKISTPLRPDRISYAFWNSGIDCNRPWRYWNCAS